MPDPIYADPRLAPVYDVFEGERDDLDAYVALTDELDARIVVDLGCGTGVLAHRLATSGRTVLGVDPAGASLHVARERSADHPVTWLEGDATVLPADLFADLVVMTGNAAQAVLDDDAWSATLRHVHAALRPGGTFAFETRRPERRAWEDWRHAAPETADVPGIGRVERRLELLDVALPRVSFRHVHRFPDGVEVVSPSTIRFRGRDEIEADLAAHGFALREVRDAPDRPGRELVVLADRPDRPDRPDRRRP